MVGYDGRDFNIFYRRQPLCPRQILPKYAVFLTQAHIIMNKIALLLCAALLAACAAPTPHKTSHHKPRNSSKTSRPATPAISEVDTLGLLLQAEQNTSGKTRSVLYEARRATLDHGTVVRGSCWDYLDHIFTKAGVPRILRQTAYQSKKSGPYAAPNQIRAGDWLYYINYDYHNIEHSGLFIGWTDYAKKQALVLSYAGSGRNEAARYKIYDLSGVYQITRAQ
ncbi:hypothetical protein GCWU000324_01822 [Kingella oralis ATCC 51147]|mgnify:CR=1 FL=1|jgi:hypothetical protein|uniref:NlpC/P60 domain-containing protein n=2 Tax=Kingella TaxID=32257 RepID=C4GIF2_9NEIS|nr:hypothetical protein GCWU000324_01822 [Kingella oralis ATCC 51147]